MIAIDLLLQCRDRRIDGCQLPFKSITPERQHGELAMLVLSTHCEVVSAAGAERRKHWEAIRRINRGGSKPDLCLRGEPDGHD